MGNKERFSEWLTSLPGDVRHEVEKVLKKHIGLMDDYPAVKAGDKELAMIADMTRCFVERDIISCHLDAEDDSELMRLIKKRAGYLDPNCKFLKFSGGNKWIYGGSSISPSSVRPPSEVSSEV